MLVLAQFVGARPSKPRAPAAFCRYGLVSVCRKLATEAPLRLSVSAGGFWCLVLRSILQRNHEVVAQAVIGPELVEQVS